jgi:hypothetical protein
MRKTLGGAALLALCVFVATVALAGTITPRGVAQPTLQTIFRFDTPTNGSTVFGIVDVKGYVLDPRGVSRITLLIDGAPVHDADINIPRIDVQNRYVRFFGEAFPYDPGFVTSFLATNYTSGDHTLAVRVTYSNSDVAELGARTVTVDNSLTQAPIGALDSPQDPDVYGVGPYVSSVYPVTGWVLDANGIRTTTAADGSILADIEVTVDGMVVGQAVYPLSRPDVANAHPDVMGALNSGFQMNLDTTRFAVGMHTISVRAFNTQGMSSVIGGRDAYFYNNYGSLGPFGQISYPMPNGHFFSTQCYSANPPSGIEFSPGSHVDWVSGWAVDQSSQRQFEGVGQVDLLFNGTIVRSTGGPLDTPGGCGPTEVAPNVVVQQNNCYGLERPDIFYLYPQFTSDAKYSGYFFAIDTDYWLRQGNLHLGLNTVGIMAHTKDPLRPAVLIDEIPVVVNCNTTGTNPSYGELEAPLTMQAVEGTVTVKGWVIDFPQSLRQLNFYVDGVRDGSLVAPNANLMMERQDVYRKYPWLPYPNSLYSGFQYTLDTSKYVDGVHQLVIESVDYNGANNYWVQRALVFDNAN